MPRITERYDVAVEASSTGQGLRDVLRALPPRRDLHRHRLLPDHQHPDPGDGHVHHQRHPEHRRPPRAPPPTGDARLHRPATGFEAERVTTLLAQWEDAPDAYAARTTKVVLRRDPLDLG